MAEINRLPHNVEATPHVVCDAASNLDTDWSGIMADLKRTTPERLRELMDYNPDTGQFTWLRGRARTARGTVAGHKCKDGYISIKIDREPNLAHRLAWLYMIGEWPPNDLDHRDRDRSNNAWSNLRLANDSLNQANKPRSKYNKSGYKGVRYWPDRNKWSAMLTVRGDRMFLGLFNSAAEAHWHYSEMAKEHFGEFARFA